MGALKKKVLFADVRAVWRNALEQVFRKEGWEIRSLGEEKEINRAGKRTYRAHLRDVEAAAILHVENPELVIMQLRGRGKEECDDLIALLENSKGREERQIYLLSDASVFATDKEAVSEVDIPARGGENPALVLLEDYALDCKRVYGVKVSILRASELYGVGMTAEDGVLGKLIYAALERRFIPYEYGAERRDFIAAEDAAFAIFRAASRKFDGDYLHIGANCAYSYEELLALCPRVFELPKEGRQEGFSYGRATLDATLCQELLGWKPRYTLEGELPRIYQDIREFLERKAQDKANLSRKERLLALRDKFVPYVENFVGFLLAYFLMRVQDGTPVNNVNFFDINYVYIGAMGLLYGKRQSMIATLLSVGMLSYAYLLRGGDLVAMLYNPSALLHLTSYLFVGVLTGYFSDREENERLKASWQREQLEERNDFLKQMLEENMMQRDRLYRQIVNSGDSIGRLYRITQRLDTVEPENVFTQAAAVTAEVLDVKDLSIYVMGRDGSYLRQKIRMGRRTEKLPRSLKVEGTEYLEYVAQEKKIFVNRELRRGVPDLAAPILCDGRVVAVLQIFGLEFSQWSLYEQNLLSVTARLIATSLRRAIEHEQNLAGHKYIEHTRFLKEAEFEKILQEFEARRDVQGKLPITLLRIRAEGLSYPELDARLSRVIRAEDFVGEKEDGLYLLLPDIDDFAADIVCKRLKQAEVAVDEERIAL